MCDAHFPDDEKDDDAINLMVRGKDKNIMSVECPWQSFYFVAYPKLQRMPCVKSGTQQ